MFTNNEHQGHSTPSLIKELCKYMCAGVVPPGEAARITKDSLDIIMKDTAYLNSSLSDNDEFAVVHRIKKHLKSTGEDQAALHFDALHKKLVTTSHDYLSNRSAILLLLLRLGESRTGVSINGNLELGRDLSHRAFDTSSLFSTGASHTSSLNARSVPVLDNSESSASFKNFSMSAARQGAGESPAWSNGLPKDNKYCVNVNTERRSRPDRPYTITQSPPPRIPLPRSGKTEISEHQMIQELIFCFQGIEGKVLRLDANNGFKIDPTVHVNKAGIVKLMMELGYLHNQVQSLLQELEEGGAVARGMACAVRDQLAHYYHQVASLDSEVKQAAGSLQADSPLAEELRSAGPTLRRLPVWQHEPLLQLQTLVQVCRACVTKRGGALVSAAYTFTNHGDPRVSTIATKLLSAAMRPLFTLMCHWVVQGELYDAHDEFFVAVNKLCLPHHNTWKDKYFLRSELVPEVMTEQQALKVLNTGKCINFLSEVCSQKLPVTGARARLRRMEAAREGELVQLGDSTSVLSGLFEAVFLEASQLVLDTLKSKFKLCEHFQGLRRYMLMGQGDFYRYLIQLLEPELNKQVEHVHRHNLLSILETAIRSTNAQYEDPEVLARLGLDTLEASSGEVGWDIFTMVYSTSGPLDTVFQLSDGSYQSLFRFLWQLKRVEFSLSNFRKEQNCMLKKLQRRTDFSELQAMLNHTSLITAEMVHYVNQVLYYILFEVVECAFEGFVAKLSAATTIDQVIQDHELFLEEIKAKTFKDDNATSQMLSTLMRSLNLSILELLNYGSEFLTVVEEEVTRRDERDAAVALQGTDHEDERQHRLRVQQFNSRQTQAAQQLKVIALSYQANFRKLLVQLSFQQDYDLHLFSNRLDFNEFYKRSQPELSENIKFRRVSNFPGVSIRE